MRMQVCWRIINFLSFDHRSDEGKRFHNHYHSCQHGIKYNILLRRRANHSQHQFTQVKYRFLNFSDKFQSHRSSFLILPSISNSWRFKDFCCKCKGTECRGNLMTTIEHMINSVVLHDIRYTISMKGASTCKNRFICLYDGNLF